MQSTIAGKRQNLNTKLPQWETDARDLEKSGTRRPGGWMQIPYPLLDGLQGMNVSVGGLCSAFIYHSLTYVLTNINERQLGPTGRISSCNFSLIGSQNDLPEMRLCQAAFPGNTCWQDTETKQNKTTRQEWQRYTRRHTEDGNMWNAMLVRIITQIRETMEKVCKDVTKCGNCLL